jgi:hypothetical protein
MAEDKESNPLSEVYLFGALLLFLIILWFANGGPQRAKESGGLYLTPPAAPQPPYSP